MIIRDIFIDYMIRWWRSGISSTFVSGGGAVNENEICIDLIESLGCTVDRLGRLLNISLTGEITVDSNLKGIPNFKLMFKNPQFIRDSCILSFHPPVSRQKWMRDQTINFIPPNGKFCLLQYSYTKPLSSVPADTVSMKPLIGTLMLPLNAVGNFIFNDVAYDCDDDILSDGDYYYNEGSSRSINRFQASKQQEKEKQISRSSIIQQQKKNRRIRTGRFELKLSPRNGFGTLSSLSSINDLVLENVRLLIPLPQWVSGIKTVAGRASGITAPAVATCRPGDTTTPSATGDTCNMSSGTLKFNNKQKTLIWNLGKYSLDLKKQVDVTCSGIINTEEEDFGDAYDDYNSNGNYVDQNYGSDAFGIDDHDDGRESSSSAPDTTVVGPDSTSVGVKSENKEAGDDDYHNDDNDDSVDDLYNYPSYHISQSTTTKVNDENQQNNKKLRKPLSKLKSTKKRKTKLEASDIQFSAFLISGCQTKFYLIY